MAEIVPLQLSGSQALRMIRELASDSNRIVILNHAQKRQRERNVTRRQIELCLQRGTITEGPFKNAHGNWQVDIYRHGAGEELTCGVAIDWPNNLLVITVF